MWKRCEPEICATQYTGYNRGQLYIYRDGDGCSPFGNVITTVE
jgi:hypothetical protein